MSENTFKGPTFRYGPHGEAQIFHDSRQVPVGWADSPARAVVVTEPAQDTEQDAPPLPLSRSEIIALLKERNMAFRVTAKTAILYALLMSAVERETEDESP